MRKTKLLAELRKMSFKEIYNQRAEKRLTVEEAARILGVCERTFRRHCRRYEEEGIGGLCDKRLGKLANNTAPVDEAMEVISLFETHYPNFSVSHFYDKYRDEYKGTRSYTWVKNKLQSHGLVNRAKKRGAHRKKRPRNPIPGMMIHQDGSTHEWVLGSHWDLIVTMDDANNEVYSAFFVEEEGTWSSFRGVKDVIEKRGLFCSIYTDRGSHYWSTPEVGGKVDKVNLTQFGRAMRQLSIEMIPAYSPEARGRSERVFRTLQDRLVKELRLEGITDMQKANDFLIEDYVQKYNKKFMVKPAEAGSAFVKLVGNNIDLNDILCIEASRKVKNDNTVSYNGIILQIPKNKFRYNYAKTTVKIHEHFNGTMGIFYGPRLLGRYNKQGDLLK